MDLLFSTLADNASAVITSAKAFTDACARIAQRSFLRPGDAAMGTLRRQLLDTATLMPQVGGGKRLLPLPVSHFYPLRILSSIRHFIFASRFALAQADNRSRRLPQPRLSEIRQSG
jgi:hypothetical protein